MRRLRDGCSIKDLLISARELSSVSNDDQSSEDVLMTTEEPDMTYRPLETSLHAGVDPGSNQSAGEIRVAPRPTLPPISSIWYLILLVWPCCMCNNIDDEQQANP